MAAVPGGSDEGSLQVSLARVFLVIGKIGVRDKTVGLQTVCRTAVFLNCWF